ncbi:MAG: hypothetical protein GWP06_02210 [Actinobacteria bacterium]|nr:hypothetical protein [Actinomycetota bacterium]
MHDSLTLSLPYPVYWLGLRFSINRKIGFSFTNLSIFLFREDANISTSDDYNKWIEEKGQTVLVNEMLFFSAKAYCMLERKKENFTQTGLKIAIATAPAENQQRLMKTWKESQTFGMTSEKKKPVRKRKK